MREATIDTTMQGCIILPGSPTHPHQKRKSRTGVPLLLLLPVGLAVALMFDSLSLERNAFSHCWCGLLTALPNQLPCTATSHEYGRSGVLHRHDRKRSSALVSTRASSSPVLEVPLQTMRLPDRFVGRGYFLVQLLVKGATLLTLLLDTGLTAPVILTNAACTRLGISSYMSDDSEAIGATGTLSMRSVLLDGAEVWSGADGAPRMQLGPMYGNVVDDFAQRKIGEEVGVSLDGMLGRGFLERCDIELNEREGQLRVWRPGDLPRDHQHWRLLQSLRLPGSLQGLLLSMPGALEPVVGIVDTGATHTVVNKHAAYVLGLQMPSQQLENRTVRGKGLDNTALVMPLVTLQDPVLCSASSVSISTNTPDSNNGVRSWIFGNVACSPRENVGPLLSADVAIGDIAFFEELLSQPQDSIGRFKGPAALIGQDLLSQQPLRLSAPKGEIWMKLPP